MQASEWKALVNSEVVTETKPTLLTVSRLLQVTKCADCT